MCLGVAGAPICRPSLCTSRFWVSPEPWDADREWQDWDSLAATQSGHPSGLQGNRAVFCGPAIGTDSNSHSLRPLDMNYS